MQIIDPHLDFPTLQNRSRTTRIVVHHSASPDVSAVEIHGWHLARGWSGIGYHYLIRANGTVEMGRPVDAQGAHTLGYNEDSIGICLTGDFMQTAPTLEQLTTLTELVLELNEHFGPLEICRHCDLTATDCPGDQFPWREFRRELNRLQPNLDQETWKSTLLRQCRSSGLISGDHSPDDLAPKWFVLAVALNLKASL